MKYLLSLLLALALIHYEGMAAPDGLAVVVPAEQSVEDINTAARDQVVRQLGLSGAKRREFESLYAAYRAALDKAIVPVDNAQSTDEVTLSRNMKIKLANIAATAQVKRDYIDRFATILTAEQIRVLYNAEGAIGTSIKSAAASRTPRISTLQGSGRLVSQDWGQAGNYSEIVAGLYCDVTVSPVAQSISVTADDNVIDYVAMKNEGGKLEFRFNANANNLQNITIRITVPQSAALNTLTAGTYGQLTLATPLRAESVKVDISSYGSVNAEIENNGQVQVSASSYGRFKGPVRCAVADFKISSYARAEGAVECRDSCRFSLSSYARFADAIKAPRLTLSVSSYAKFTGSVTASQARISLGSYGTFDSSFVGNSLRTSVGSYAKMTLRGSARVADVTADVAYGALLNAPDLQVTDYNLTVVNNGKADVWCSGNLKISASPQARVTYAGPGTVQAQSENIRRRP